MRFLLSTLRFIHEVTSFKFGHSGSALTRTNRIVGSLIRIPFETITYVLV